MSKKTQNLQAGTSPGPNPSPNPAQLEVHPGWVRSGVDNTPGHKAYYINLEAKPGMGDKVEQFRRDILAGVEYRVAAISRGAENAALAGKLGAHV